MSKPSAPARNSRSSGPTVVPETTVSSRSVVTATLTEFV
jgi:hypothetical protein